MIDSIKGHEAFFHLWATQVVSFKRQAVFVLMVNNVENSLCQLVKRAESTNYYIFPNTTNWGRKKHLRDKNLLRQLCQIPCTKNAPAECPATDKIKKLLQCVRILPQTKST